MNTTTTLQRHLSTAYTGPAYTEEEKAELFAEIYENELRAEFTTAKDFWLNLDPNTASYEQIEAAQERMIYALADLEAIEGTPEHQVAQEWQREQEARSACIRSKAVPNPIITRGGKRPAPATRLYTETHPTPTTTTAAMNTAKPQRPRTEQMGGRIRHTYTSSSHK